MRKFIISFEFQKISFSAKVNVIKSDNIIFYTITLLQNDFLFELNGIRLTFIKDAKGFTLMLVYEDNSFEIVPWEIKLAYLDNSGSIYRDVFSLS